MCSLTTVNCGSRKTHSACSITKAALVLSVLVDYKLGILALCETWVEEDAPATVKADVASNSFRVRHICLPEGNSGGDLALVHRANTSDSIHPLAARMHCSSFELQPIDNGLPSIANTCRPTAGLASRYIGELADFPSMFISQPSNQRLLCGDISCRQIYNDLVDVLDMFDLRQHVTKPTRDDNLLDLVVSD